MKSKKWTLGLFIFYLAALTWIIVFKFSFSLEHLPHIRTINIIPFGGPVIVNGKIDTSEIIQNFLAFVPYGLLISVLLEEKMLLKKWFPIVLTSFLFEAAQFIFAIGFSDITDLITNSTGGFVGILIGVALSKILPRYWIQIMNGVSLAAAALLGFFISLLVAVNI